MGAGQRDCRVIVSGHREDALYAVASKSSYTTPRIGDVTNDNDRTALAKALAELPAPRALFHGAGYFQLGQLGSISSADWQRSLDVNVTVRWALSQLCAPHLDGGRLLLIGSDAGANPRVGAAAYSVAQSASETLRRALQAEWVDRDVAIAGFKSGLVNTDMVRGFLAQSETDFPSCADYQAYIDRGEITTSETIAAFAAWLLLDVDATRFSATEWDVRHSKHHPEWLEGQLHQAAPPSYLSHAV
jgi:NAD(P)-dependent dehydrogenase (short-subunit alcohol dehydrogenase family)